MEINELIEDVNIFFTKFNLLINASNAKDKTSMPLFKMFDKTCILDEDIEHNLVTYYRINVFASFLKFIAQKPNDKEYGYFTTRLELNLLDILIKKQQSTEPCQTLTPLLEMGILLIFIYINIALVIALI